MIRRTVCVVQHWKGNGLPLVLLPHVKAINFIESSSYHALWRNCIHAADLLLRVMTGGALRNGPILYDLIAGEVPKVRCFAHVVAVPT